MQIIQRLCDQLLYHCVVVAYEVGLVVVVESVLHLAHLMMRETNSQVGLRMTWLDSQTLLVKFNSCLKVSVELKINQEKNGKKCTYFVFLWQWARLTRIDSNVDEFVSLQRLRAVARFSYA